MVLNYQIILNLFITPFKLYYIYIIIFYIIIFSIFYIEKIIIYIMNNITLNKHIFF